MKLKKTALMTFAMLSSILGSGKAEPKPDSSSSGSDSEQCVLIQFPFPGKDLQPVFDLEEKIIKAIEKHGSGEFDGNEVGGGEVTLYMYGKKADALFDSIEGILKKEKLIKGGTVTKRYGPAGSGAKETKIKL